MTSDTDSERVRELKLEGASLAIAAVALVATLFGTFLLGRNFERRQHPAARVADSSSVGTSTEFSPQAESKEIDKGNFFDTIEGAGKEAEPSREVAREVSADEPTPRREARDAASLPAPDGQEFWVQVFAGRDEGTAADYVRKLKSAGHTVRLFTEREGSGSLYKVRVGAWAEHGTAGRAAETLKKQGYSGSWVTRVPS